jgi:hypothetical protein
LLHLLHGSSQSFWFVSTRIFQFDVFSYGSPDSLCGFFVEEFLVQSAELQDLQFLSVLAFVDPLRVELLRALRGHSTVARIADKPGERRIAGDHRENVVHVSPDELPKEGPLWYGEPLREVQESLAGFPVERHPGLDKGLTCFGLQTTGQPPA